MDKTAIKTDAIDRTDHLLVSRLFPWIRTPGKQEYFPYSLGAYSATTDMKVAPEDDEITSDEHTRVLTQGDIQVKITQYEQMFQMSSDEFSSRLRAGTAPDTFDAVVWKTLLKYHRR